jgi:hypothetical protein
MIDWWAKFTYWFGNKVNTNYSGLGIMLSTELDAQSFYTGLLKKDCKCYFK